MTGKFSSGSHEIILKRIRDIPSLPEVVNKMVQLLGEPNTPASKIAQLISYDPGLTSKVLRMVNSAAYGFQRQISSIQHGIMILGFSTVRGLVLSASILKMFEGKAPGTGKGLDHLNFWRHSLGTAMAARLVAKSLRLPDSDDAFSAGMLHDIGKIVLDVYFSHDYKEVIEHARRRSQMHHGLGFLVLEQATLGIDHTQIGSFLANKWKLPVGITEVIQYHHCPAQAPTCQSLVYLVALASQLAVVLYECAGVYSRSHFSDDVVEYFDLTDDDLQGFLDALKADLDAAEDLLKSISASTGGSSSHGNMAG